MLSDTGISKMVTANLALWRPLELLRPDACDPAEPSHNSTVTPRVPAEQPLVPAVSPRVPAVSPRVPALSPCVLDVSPRVPAERPLESRAYTRGGLPAGWCSREFSTQELLAYTCPKEPMIVLVEARGSSPAAVCARLAGSVPGAALRLERAVSHSGLTVSHTGLAVSHPGLAVSHSGLAVPPTAWRVRCVIPAPPGELRLWFDYDLLHLFRIPYLSIENIIHSSRYECVECGAVFAEPNPLKVHAALRCAGAGAGARERERERGDAGLRALWARAAGGALAACPAQAERLAAALGARSPGGAHACVYCGRVYSRRYGLRIHVRTHTGWRPLRCAVCRRAFADPSNLNKHNKLHRLRGDLPPPGPPGPAAP